MHPRQTSTVPDHPEPPDRPPVPAARESVQRWRLVVEREALGSDLAGQREQLAAWEDALRRSGLPVAGLDATPPKPRFAIAAPLAASIPGEAELADVWLCERLPAWRVREALAASLPGGYTLVDAYDVWLGAPALPGQVTASVYRATFAPGTVDRSALQAAASAMLRAVALPRERQKGQGTVRYDLRPFLEDLATTEPADGAGVALLITLRHDPEKGIGRPDEAIAAVGAELGMPITPSSIVRERVILATPPVPSPPPARSRARRRAVSSAG